MERRLFVVLAVAAVAVVAVGLSAAATMSRGDSAQPTKEVQVVKPAKKAASRASERSADTPVASTTGRSQSAEEAERYWTKERMEDAQPLEKTRPGGSPSSSPAPTGTTVPGSAPTTTTKATPRKSSSTRTKKSADDTGVVTGPSANQNPGYWTDEAMDGAQPMDQTRPGGSGSQSDPGSSGTTVPGSPPP